MKSGLSEPVERSADSQIGLFAVFDTNAEKLNPPELRYIFGGYSLADLILRAGLHHTNDKIWLEIFGFKNS